MLYFTSDYMEGAHPKVLEELTKTNLVHSEGYGTDEFSERAKEKIRKACSAPDADVFFLIGGTQTNAIVIDSLLESYQGVISADTGHICSHEAGAVEYTGHKIIQLPNKDGKISALQINECLEKYTSDENADHLVMPALVYLSQPTEYGTLYSKKELSDISSVCKKYNLSLFIDGARLAYALACKDNDVSLNDLAKFCDAFYIGGTKCGAMFGEAVVFPVHNRVKHFFTLIKQHGALLAKGRILGVQFETLFTDDLYEKIGSHALILADKIRNALSEIGRKQIINSPTNQIFLLLSNEEISAIKQSVQLSFWEKYDNNHTVMRLVTSWATTEEDVDKLILILKNALKAKDKNNSFIM